MHDMINAINWEHVGMVVVSILSAFGVTFGWLKRMCSRIESTNLDVEAHKEEIKRLVEQFSALGKEMTEVMRVVQEVQKPKKE